MKRSPLRAKRPTPRRNEGRIVHARLKPKASAEPTAEQARYHAHLRATALCEGCGGRGHHIHHLLASAPGKTGRRDHWFVVLLCAGCHNGRSDSVHLLGSEARFLEVHGVDLVAVAVLRLTEWQGLRTTP